MSSPDSRQTSSADSTQKVFALIDCNNFFVSCERLFRPELSQVPVAVLSNNDGCVIARSNEVRAMGIKMGEPYFKRKSLLEAHKTEIFSANFALYGDIADRVYDVLSNYSPRAEVYSIDEVFLQVDGLNIADYNAWAKQLSEDVERQIGVPVSVGVGSTKTLAKLATERVKRIPSIEGGFSLVEDEKLGGYDLDLAMEESLRWLPLENVWGIGRRRAYMLHRRGLKTAHDVTRLTDEWVLKNMTITGLQTVRELRGDSRVSLDEFENDNQQKSLSATRSFGRKVRSLAELEAAIASFSARAATRLRRKEQLAWKGLTFVRAKMPDKSTRYLSTEFQLPVPTSFTSDIIIGAHRALEQIYDPDLRYEKGGVILTSLVDESEQQMSLFGEQGQAERMESQISLMKAMDDLSLRYGKQAVTFASESYGSQRWRSKKSRVSPAYTTKWSELPTVRIS